MEYQPKQATLTLTQQEQRTATLSLRRNGTDSYVGWVTSAPMPHDGLCYFVELTDDNTGAIIAYADTFGRIFLTNSLLSAPPAFEPHMEFVKNPLYDKERGFIKHHGEILATYQRINRRFRSPRYIIENPKVDQILTSHQSITQPLGFIDALLCAFIALTPEHVDGVDVTKSSQDHHEHFFELCDKLHTFLSVKEVCSLLSSWLTNLRERATYQHSHPDYPKAYEHYLARLLEVHNLATPSFSKELKETQVLFGQMKNSSLTQVIIGDDTPQSLARWAHTLESVLMRVTLIALDANPPATEGQCSVFDQRLFESCAYEAPRFDAHTKPSLTQTTRRSIFDPWNAYYASAKALSSLVFPYKLEASFRLSSKQERALIHLTIPHEEDLMKVRYIPALSVWSTLLPEEQQAMQARFAVRAAIVHAATLFSKVPTLESVTVQLLGNHSETPVHHLEQISADRHMVTYGAFMFTRSELAPTNYRRADSVYEFIDLFGLNSTDEGQVLVAQNAPIALDDPAFFDKDCYHSVEQKHEEIPRLYRPYLYASTTNDLGIIEGVDRIAAAFELDLDESDQSIQGRVARVLQLKEAKRDLPDVQQACDRVLTSLVNGEFDNLSEQELSRKIVSDGALSQALSGASELMLQESYDEAFNHLNPALSALDEKDTYRDTDDVVYRSFSSYSERIVYNYLNRHDKRAVKLVPDDYFNAYVAALTCLLELKRLDEAEVVGKRALLLNPLSGRVAIRLLKVYELQGKDLAAMELLKTFLRTAHKPSDIAVAYYRLAFWFWNQHDVRTSCACYMLSLESELLSPTFEHAQEELKELVSINPSLENMSLNEARELLSRQGFNPSPNQDIVIALKGALKAALSLGYFSVAQQLIEAVAGLTYDEYLLGVAQAIKSDI